jgi:hypothetical protein
MVGEQPVRVDQLGRLAGNEGHARNLSRRGGLDDFVADDRKVDDFLEGIADFARAVVQAEQAHLFTRQVAIDSGQRQDGLAQLHPKLARAGSD